MRVEQLQPGLWRWTGLHPEWTSDDGGPDGWEQEVGCVYAEADDAVLLIDPLIPPEDEQRFLDALDRDVDRSDRPVAILLTSPWHVRSARELAARYGAEVHAPNVPNESVEGAHAFAFGDSLPGGVQTFDAHFHGESLFWLPVHRALVAGDVLVGRADGLRVAPDSWLAEHERGGRIRESLRHLLELPVELVLVGHGEPVRADAGRALTSALAAGS